jgi:NAD(P)-dependent dehydrogenase (short-subunit alcohol dehydrogenase family)
MNRVQNKIAIVAGATSGIGKASAHLLAKEGATVIFTGRREEKGKAIENEWNAEGLTTEFFRCDSTKKDELEALISHVVEKYGRIDILHNNMGVAFPCDFLEATEESFDTTMETNLKSYFTIHQLIIPQMIKQNGGSIINTASIGATYPLPMNASYAASKAGVIQMTRSLAIGYVKNGIRINCVCPGLTYSEMVTPGDSFDNWMLPLVPMGRGAQPEEIANGVLYLASDESSYVTGQALYIDGGICL